MVHTWQLNKAYLFLKDVVSLRKAVLSVYPEVQAGVSGHLLLSCALYQIVADSPSD